MRNRRLVILATILCEWITGCGTMGSGNTISQITYTSDSGPILPELQWHEQIIIAMNEISLTRNGRVETTEVNAGTWEFAADEQKVTALFEQLQAVDCTSIKRIEPDDPPDGGHTESYTIHYTNGEKCSLVYDPGTTYTNGRLIVDPSKAFVQSLAPPADAASRYRFSP